MCAHLVHAYACIFACVDVYVYMCMQVFTCIISLHYLVPSSLLTESVYSSFSLSAVIIMQSQPERCEMNFGFGWVKINLIWSFSHDGSTSDLFPCLSEEDKTKVRDVRLKRVLNQHAHINVGLEVRTVTNMFKIIMPATYHSYKHFSYLYKILLNPLTA